MIEAYIIFAICMIGCAATAWSLGKQQGIENTVEYLIDKGAIEVEDT